MLQGYGFKKSDEKLPLFQYIATEHRTPLELRSTFRVFSSIIVLREFFTRGTSIDSIDISL